MSAIWPSIVYAKGGKQKYLNQAKNAKSFIQKNNATNY
jgi:hypothetical protein